MGDVRVFATGVLLVAVAAAHAGPHVHGEATLDLVVEDRLLYMELTAPADTLVGFETAPRSAAQRQAVADAVIRLHVGSELLQLPASCLVAEVDVQSPFAEPPDSSASPDEDHHHAGDHADAGHHVAETAHADFSATYQVSCREPLPRSLEIRLFRSFPRLVKLQVQYVADGRQGSATLTSDNPELRW